MPCGSVTIRKHNQKGRMLNNNCDLAMHRFVWSSTLSLFLMALTNHIEKKTKKINVSTLNVLIFLLLELRSIPQVIVDRCQIVKWFNPPLPPASVPPCFDKSAGHIILLVTFLSFNCRSIVARRTLIASKCSLAVPCHFPPAIRTNCECIHACKTVSVFLLY